MTTYLFTPSAWDAVVAAASHTLGEPGVEELCAAATRDDTYVALELGERRRRDLADALLARRRSDPGSDALFRACMVLAGPLGPPPYVSRRTSRPSTANPRRGV